MQYVTMDDFPLNRQIESRAVDSSGIFVYSKANRCACKQKKNQQLLIRRIKSNNLNALNRKIVIVDTLVRWTYALS